MNPNEIKEFPPIRRNTIAEMKEILDAIEQGKQLQCYDAHYDNWYDAANNKHPNFSDYTYRIKPEELKEKWRPFRNRSEFMMAANQNVHWVMSKNTERYNLVTTIYPNGVTADGVFMTWKCLFEHCTFTNCTPCGVLEEGA